MGCNCKKTAESAKKYTDEETIVELHGIEKVKFFLRKIIIVVLSIIVFIIGIPLLIIKLIIDKSKGKKIRINLSKIIKVFHVKEQ